MSNFQSGSIKQKRPSEAEHSVKALRTETSRQLSLTYICVIIFSFDLQFITLEMDSDKQFNCDRVVTTVADVGPPANWVKINVRETVSIVISMALYIYNMRFNFLQFPSWLYVSHAQKDCFEVYALVPGLLREEVINYLATITFFFIITISEFLS